jgi:Xaa-Pro dipeptidase
MPHSAMAKEIRERIKALQGLLREHHIDGALILQRVALYYFTGTEQDAHLWIPVARGPLLMVRKSLDRALRETPLEKVVPLPSYSQLPEYLEEHEGALPQKIGLELDVLPVNMFRAYQKAFPGTSLVDIAPLVRQVRTVKSPHEISLIQKAAEIGDRLYDRIPEFLEEAKTEMALAMKAEAFYRGQGHPGLVRMRSFNAETVYGHIMAGPSLAVPSWNAGPTGGPGLGPYASQGSSRAKIAPRTPLLVDYVSCVEGYISDQTRIFSKGRLPEKFYRAHQVMLEVQDALADKARPGALAGDLYAAAIKIVERAGLSEGFMGHPQPVPFVGHGIGLELDEWPVIGRNSGHILRNGHVIALEPKVIFPGQGAAGIENTFVVRDHGMEKLNRFPDEICVIP